MWAVLTPPLATILAFTSHIVSGWWNGRTSVRFFHPYTNDGGEGEKEKVLRCAVKGIQEESPDVQCVVYTGDHDSSPHSLMIRFTDHFLVHLLYPPEVVQHFSYIKGIGLKRLRTSFGKTGGNSKIMSVAQFHPEKAHSLQLGERLQNLKDKAAILKDRWGCQVPQQFNVQRNKSQGLGKTFGKRCCWNPFHDRQALRCNCCRVHGCWSHPNWWSFQVSNFQGPKLDFVLDEDGQQTGFLAHSLEEYSEAILRGKNA